MSILGMNNRINTLNQNQALLNSFNSINNRRPGFSQGGFDPFSSFGGFGNFGVNNAQASADVRSFLTGMRDTASRLNTAMNNLRGAGAETVISSDTSAVSVSMTNQNARIEDTTIRVNQVASGQVNQGASLQADRRVSTADARNHTFEIEINGNTRQLSVRVGMNDSQQDVQNAVARAINNANMGVSASVEATADGRNSTLTVQATETGAFEDGRNTFQIRDVSGRAVEMTGVSAQTGGPRDAQFSINGGAMITQRSNDIDLGQGVTATLRAANANRDITIGMGRESRLTEENVNAMVRQFNTLLSNTADNRDDRGVNRLHFQLRSLSTSFGASLAQVGISVDREGMMSVNSSRLDRAIQDGSLNRFLNSAPEGASFGFANRLSRISEDVAANPHRYMSTESMNLLEPTGRPFAIPGQNANNMLNAMRASRQNSIFTMGMLLDMFV